MKKTNRINHAGVKGQLKVITNEREKKKKKICGSIQSEIDQKESPIGSDGQTCGPFDHFEYVSACVMFEENIYYFSCRKKIH